MGARESRPSGAAAPPRNFYLVVGGPPIVYTRASAANPGPLLFNVQLPMTSAPELVEETLTVKNHINVSSKQDIKLTPIHESDFDKGFQIALSIDATTEPTRVRLLSGCDLSFSSGTGLQVSQANAHQKQHVIFEETNWSLREEAPEDPDMLGQPVTLQPFSAPHEPILLQHLEPCPPAHELRTAGSLKSCPLLLEVQYAANVLDEAGEAISEQRTLFTALSFSKEQLERERASPSSPCFIRAQIAKQFLQVVDAVTGKLELFEIDDIFDLGGEATSVPVGAGNSGAEGDQQETDAAAPQEDDDDDNTCVVCLTNPKDTTIIPCRHMCLCSECAALLRHQTNKCPVCRCPIERLMTRKL